MTSQLVQVITRFETEQNKLKEETTEKLTSEHQNQIQQLNQQLEVNHLRTVLHPVHTIYYKLSQFAIRYYYKRNFWS